MPFADSDVKRVVMTSLSITQSPPRSYSSQEASSLFGSKFSQSVNFPLSLSYVLSLTPDISFFFWLGAT